MRMRLLSPSYLGCFIYKKEPRGRKWRHDRTQCGKGSGRVATLRCPTGHVQWKGCMSHGLALQLREFMLGSCILTVSHVSLIASSSLEGRILEDKQHSFIMCQPLGKGQTQTSVEWQNFNPKWMPTTKFSDYKPFQKTIYSFLIIESITQLKIRENSQKNSTAFRLLIKILVLLIC